MVGADALLAQEDKAERRQRVERDPEDGDELLLERQRRGLGGLLNVGQVVQLVRCAGVDVVDEAVG
jgi:hypothetical protein